jgi:hypothetical protein
VNTNLGQERRHVKTVFWLYVVSVALFVSGIGFIIAGARESRRAPTTAERVAIAVTPVATVKQIMKGIVGPAATAIFGAVGTTITAAGTEEKAPKTDDEWEALGNSAAALIESGNLLLIGNRTVDNGDWVQMSQAMIASGQTVLKAAQAKNADGVFAAGEAVTLSCDSCHHKYQRGS